MASAGHYIVRRPSEDSTGLPWEYLTSGGAFQLKQSNAHVFNNHDDAESVANDVGGEVFPIVIIFGKVFSL